MRTTAPTSLGPTRGRTDRTTGAEKYANTTGSVGETDRPPTPTPTKAKDPEGTGKRTEVGPEVAQGTDEDPTKQTDDDENPGPKTVTTVPPAEGPREGTTEDTGTEDVYETTTPAEKDAS